MVTYVFLIHDIDPNSDFFLSHKHTFSIEKIMKTAIPMIKLDETNEIFTGKHVVESEPDCMLTLVSKIKKK